MRKIVIFTKNVLAEKELRNHLEFLNYEVFVTKNVHKREDVKMFSEIFKIFHIVIFSETLSNEEFLTLSKYFVNEEIVCIRRTEDEEGMNYSNSREGLHYLSINSSLSELREKLSNLFRETKPFPKTNEQCFHDFHNALSRLETTVVRELSETLGKTVSREDLCNRIWPGRVNNSRLVQVSTAVRNIRKKAQQSGITNLNIMTYWGKGYELNVIDEVSLSYLNSNLKSS